MGMVKGSSVLVIKYPIAIVFSSVGDGQLEVTSPTF